MIRVFFSRWPVLLVFPVLEGKMVVQTCFVIFSENVSCLPNALNNFLNKSRDDCICIESQKKYWERNQKAATFLQRRVLLSKVRGTTDKQYSPHSLSQKQKKKHSTAQNRQQTNFFRVLCSSEMFLFQAISPVWRLSSLCDVAWGTISSTRIYLRV